MFGTKITKVEDTIIDYSKYSGIEKDEYVVDDHRVKVSVSKLCKNLSASLKYVMLELIPTKKFSLIESDIVTDEMKIISSKIIEQLRMVRIASDCPYDSFKLFFKYKTKPIPDLETGKTFIYINTRDIELYNEVRDGAKPSTSNRATQEGYFNAMNFCAIEFGKYIKIEGKIESHTSYGSNSIHKYITTEFKQRYTISSNDVMEYYDGSFEFHYIDNKDANDVIAEALNILISIIDDISNREEKFKLSLDSYSIDVALDRSSVIANLIDSYIQMQTKNRVIKTNKESINGITKISFIDIAIDELTLILDKALKALRSELTNLVADLK